MRQKTIDPSQAGSLKEHDPELDKKLKLLTVRRLTPQATVTKDELIKGLEGPASHEFFARLHARRDNHTALMENLGDEKVRAGVLKLAEDPDKLVDELKKTMGGKFVGIPKHSIRAARLGATIASKDGRNLYLQMVSQTNGAKAAASLFTDPVGPRIMSTVGKLGGEQLIEDMQKRVIEGLEQKDKPSNRVLWPLAKPVTTSHLDEAQDDRAIRDLIRGTDKKKVMEAVSEFFKSDKNFDRFRSFVADDHNRTALSATLKDDASWTQYAFLNVLKTDGGKERLAKGIADPNGSKVIVELAKDLEGQEAIFGMLHATERKASEAGEGIQEIRHGWKTAKLILAEPGGPTSLTKVMTTVYLRRLMKGKGGLGDVPQDKVDRVAQSLE